MTAMAEFYVSFISFTFSDSIYTTDKPNVMIICAVSVMLLTQAQEMKFHIYGIVICVAFQPGDNKHNKRVL